MPAAGRRRVNAGSAGEATATTAVRQTIGRPRGRRRGGRAGGRRRDERSTGAVGFAQRNGMQATPRAARAQRKRRASAAAAANLCVGRGESGRTRPATIRAQARRGGWQTRQRAHAAGGGGRGTSGRALPRSGEEHHQPGAARRIGPTRASSPRPAGARAPASLARERAPRLYPRRAPAPASRPPAPPWQPLPKRRLHGNARLWRRVPHPLCCRAVEGEAVACRGQRKKSCEAPLGWAHWKDL